VSRSYATVLRLASLAAAMMRVEEGRVVAAWRDVGMAKGALR
jgi:hypothetical protein